MKKKILYFVVPIVIIITISNTLELRWMFNWIVDPKHYLFSNNSGDFYITNPNSSEFEGIEERFASYIKEKNITNNDTILYRTFWRNPFTFWRYHNYLDPIYKLPYKNKNEISRFKKQE